MVQSRANRHLGIDLGATNTKWAVVEHDGAAWHAVATGQGRTPAAGGPDTVIPMLADMGRDVMAAWPGIESAGIGIPGLYDPQAGTTRFLVNMPGPWAGRPVAGPVADALGAPVSLINDARAFGLAELRLGAGRGAGTMVGLTLGTGVGGVIAIDGRIHQGHDGTAGEVGHQTIDPDGPWCGCGNRGCVEKHASATAITAMARLLGLGDAMSSKEVYELALAGNEKAVAIFESVGEILGITLALLINSFNFPLYLVAGGVIGAWDLFAPPMLAETKRRSFAFRTSDTRIERAQLGNKAGLYGAAFLPWSEK